MVALTLRAGNPENAHDIALTTIKIGQQEQSAIALKAGNGEIPLIVFGLLNERGHGISFGEVLNPLDR